MPIYHMVVDSGKVSRRQKRFGKSLGEYYSLTLIWSKYSPQKVAVRMGHQGHPLVSEKSRLMKYLYYNLGQISYFSPRVSYHSTPIFFVKDHLQECQEAHMREPLKAGDRLSFFADTSPMGSFTIDALPQYLWCR